MNFSTNIPKTALDAASGRRIALSLREAINLSKVITPFGTKLSAGQLSLLVHTVSLAPAVRR